MPFRYILANLLAETDQSVGALFIDDTGEAVDHVCTEITPTDMQVLGAYLGIYLRQLRQFLPEGEFGSLDLVQLECDNLHLYICPLPEGYFVVLAQRRPNLTARARDRLRAAGEQLHRELFRRA